jgi:hypothetical protein
MKKQTIIAFFLLMLIPVVSMVGGLLFSLINPEIAAGHPNYARNYHLLNLLKLTTMFGSVAVIAILWLLVCFLVIRSKERSLLWMFVAVLGPFGLAILAMLNDNESAKTDRYTRFVSKMNGFVRVGYEVCRFAIIWELAYEAMVLKRNLMIMYQSATTGLSTAQIIDIQNASSGMWAFAEGMEVMFTVVVLYLIWPIVFNIVGGVAAMMASSKSPRASNRSEDSRAVIPE